MAMMWLGYFSVNPEYGTMAEFQNLLAEAHQRGIRVIMDLVLNHTSTQHPWFVEANSDVNSPYRDYYILRPNPLASAALGEGLSGIRLRMGGVYYGVFWSGMPDLNYRNPAVTADMQEVIRFWLEDVGVDGFRLDAIKHLIEVGLFKKICLRRMNGGRVFYDYLHKRESRSLHCG